MRDHHRSRRLCARADQENQQRQRDATKLDLHFARVLDHDDWSIRAAAMELFWLLLEAGVALALLLGIVWWTWPRKRDEDATRREE